MVQACARAEMWLASLLSLALVGCAVQLPNPLPNPLADPLSSAMRCGYHGYCHTEAKGFITKSSLRLPDIEVPPDAKEFKFTIPDKCAEWGRELAGCVVHACDSDAAPALELGVAGVGPASLRRRGSAQAPANVYMKQYCM